MHMLHPRSKSTSTLFTTTLAVSFLVVGLPHILPCPVDKRQFADSTENSDAKQRGRRKPREDGAGVQDRQTVELEESERKKRECPVPKPGGLVGQMMGFEARDKEQPVKVVVRTLRARNAQQDGEDGKDAT